ncbi:MAG TPA: undecaprenyl-diphosphate phosphatase [Candidatus Saccharimonadales bacterium]
MSIIDAVILGLLQGFTEFIPVSSSGHLVLADKLTNIDSSFAFDVLLNIGTLAALIVYFWPKLMELAKNLISGRRHLVRSLFYSTLPVIIIGGLFIGWFESDALRDGRVVAAMLISVGLVMVYLDKMAKLRKQEMNNLPVSSALAIGVGQVMALIPGTSRSGTTMITGRLVGLSYQDAAEYSFLLAIPVVAGAVARSMFEPEAAELWASHAGSVIMGVLAAYFSGIIAIRFMLGWLKHSGLKGFGYYRIALGLLVILTVVI